MTESFDIEESVAETTEALQTEKLLGHNYSNSELIFGLVSPVGTEYKSVIEYLKERLRIHNYEVKIIHVSKDVITQLQTIQNKPNTEYKRISTFMDLGNKSREETGDNSILALGIASEIFKDRDRDEKGGVKPKERIAYIINSLKHPTEVERLKEIYTDGFYLIGIASDENRRLGYLIKEKRMTQEEAEEIIKRDQDETYGFGQHTRDTFQLADFFVSIDNNSDKLKSNIRRILNIVFGHPHITPTFDEFAIFMAFASSLRSADLSRQVGAVIAKENEIMATGANDNTITYF